MSWINLSLDGCPLVRHFFRHLNILVTYSNWKWQNYGQEFPPHSWIQISPSASTRSIKEISKHFLLFRRSFVFVTTAFDFQLDNKDRIPIMEHWDGRHIFISVINSIAFYCTYNIVLWPHAFQNLWNYFLILFFLLLRGLWTIIIATAALKDE